MPSGQPLLTSRLRFGVCAIVFLPALASGADWPAWRHDAGRTANSPQQLAAALHLRWARRLPALEPAWPDQPTMQLDAVYEPIVAGKRLFLGSSYHDGVTAYDTDTGKEIWHFSAEGPVRYAPVAWDGKLYVGCDAGYLHCLDAAKGSLLWRVRGGPSDRKVLGNERLISMWPVRGAPVVADDTVYFAAGIWPFMGIFVHAVDARTGTSRWLNDGDSCIFIKQPHNADSFAGVAPQGPLVVHGDKLLVPGGRSVPACFDRKTGKQLYYHLGENGKRGGGSEVIAGGGTFYNGGSAYLTDTGKHLGLVPRRLVLTEGILFGSDRQELTALDLKSAKVRKVVGIDRKGKKTTADRWAMEPAGKTEAKLTGAFIKAGNRLYTGGKDEIAAHDLPLPEQGSALPSWQFKLTGTVTSLIAADDKLFAVTKDGGLYCFGGDQQPMATQPAPPPLPAADGARARSVLQTAGVQAGYGLIWGDPGFPLLRGLLEQSSLNLIVIEPDARKVHTLRAILRDSSISGERLAVLHADPSTVVLPQYLAGFTLVEQLAVTPDSIRKVFQSLRPYGGVAVWKIPAEQHLAFKKLVTTLEMPGAEVRHEGARSLLVRAGALPGSANWTHEHGDAANTRVSRDTVVKAPLGVLWWGGASNDGILPRHGHGPQPQVIDGRLFIEGIDMLRAMDVYTGRIIWETKLRGVGAFYNNLAHQPGANATGANYVSTAEGIYVVHGRKCVRLDPATGKTLSEFPLPNLPGIANSPRWGYVSIVGEYLIGGADPLFDANVVKPDQSKDNTYDKDPKEEPKEEGKIAKVVAKVTKATNDNLSSSKHLFVMDRFSGKLLWSATADHGFRHNGICAGNGRLYCIDRLSGNQLSRLKRRGEGPKTLSRLIVLDLATGKEIWKTDADVFGTWLSYSVARDVLIEAGRVARDSIADEPAGMRAYQGATGKVAWCEKKHSGPAIILGDTILMNANACALLTGKLKKRDDPLTGEAVDWTWSRGYGCNTPMASEHMLTFRSGAAGFFDLCADGGTGNWGGFRSSCTNNLIVANGVLSAPDYTRTCSCNYQNQTSLALVPMPDVEMWTTFGAKQGSGRVKRVGINFGAPGDRRDDKGTLWIEHPSVGGKSPAVPMTMIPAKPEYVRRHSSRLNGEGLPWVSSSAVKGLHALTVELAPRTGVAVQRSYTIRLHFAELDEVGEGERIFDVGIQGQTVLKRLDIVNEAGGRNRGLVKEFKGVKVARELVVTFTPSAGVKTPASLLNGLEILIEE